MLTIRARTPRIVGEHEELKLSKDWPWAADVRTPLQHGEVVDARPTSPAGRQQPDEADARQGIPEGRQTEGLVRPSLGLDQLRPNTIQSPSGDQMGTTSRVMVVRDPSAIPTITISETPIVETSKTSFPCRMTSMLAMAFD